MANDKDIPGDWADSDELDLPNGYWLKKENDNGWWLGRGRMNLALKIVPNVPCGQGGSIDSEVKEFARLIQAGEWKCKVRAAGLTDPPQDCNWPTCGCDPYADKVIEALNITPDRNVFEVAMTGFGYSSEQTPDRTGQVSEVVTLPPRPRYELQVQLKFKDAAGYTWGGDTWWADEEIYKARKRIQWHRNGFPIGGEDVRLVRVKVVVVCPECGGTGNDPPWTTDEYEPLAACSLCKGTGKG